MAGSGRRVFSPGEVLTASNTMNYLMDQTVMNFSGTAARGSAIGTAVAEGMVSYLADTDVVEAYDGTAWKNLARTTGSIIQVVHSSVTTETTITSTSYVTSNLTATITPKYATSNILVMLSTNVTTASATGVLALFRGTVAGTNLSSGTWGFGRFIAEQQSNWAYLDSPATTSATTYTLGAKVATTGTIYLQNASTPGRITLMEISA